MKKQALLFLFLLAALTSQAQYQGAKPGYKMLAGNDWVKSKNYYLLSLLQQDKPVSKLISSDPALSKLAQDKYRDLQESRNACKEARCLPAALKLTDQDIQLVSARLRALYQPGSPLEILVKTHLIPSGSYILYNSGSAADLLVKAWEQDAAALNFTIGVYAEGKKPNYPAIDSISYDVNNRNYYTLMHDCSADIEAEVGQSPLFFEPALQAALTYLEVNDRRNAADFEPMASRANKPAIEKVRTVNWNNFPYTHILVPGAGPDDAITALSGEGMLRCKAAARQYRAGKAPFLVVSGGNVHPYKTKFNEAVEMKEYLINQLHIPASAIIIEPHARHTTTNLRNDTRLAFHYGIPISKLALIVTDKYQNDFITTMEKRCIKELNYVPYTLGKRLSETELEFFPLISSLQIDSDEPMDP